MEPEWPSLAESKQAAAVAEVEVEVEEVEVEVEAVAEVEVEEVGVHHLPKPSHEHRACPVQPERQDQLALRRRIALNTNRDAIGVLGC